jgi:MFS family permease
VYPLDVAALRGLLAARARPRSRPVIVRTVWLLGLVSLLTDISSEMVSSILPVYLFVHLQLSPVQFGLIDGLYHGVTAVARLASGVVADRWRQYKLVAALGYALSAACKLGLFATGTSWTGFAAILSADRVGKGIRTAPRDALISLTSGTKDLASAFGVHRAMDTLGVLAGPLLAYWILARVPGRFDAIFVVSFAVALIGLAVLILLVQDTRAESDVLTREPMRLSSLLRDRRFVSIAAAAALTSFVVVSDAFLYLLIQWRRGGGADAIPLLYAGTACAYLVLAAPVGRLADRIGRVRVFLMGQVFMLVVYAAVAWIGFDVWATVMCLLLHGAYYAATDGVIAALMSSATQPHLRASGLAAVTTATSLTRLAGSVVVGVIWSWHGPAAVVTVALVATVATLLVSTIVLRGADGPALDVSRA